ncbi:hypothetical protein GCM10022222_55630 [Amycolatopsis ultiminotia]|uniref:AB hydrolase-1 domain-containing protein n=1 Tax=Amycolatopsis ultiminotia TaxID=543629 RepID=A0ABP6XEA9_9PSEU
MVVLVGHSHGGAVITNAAASDPDVKAVVYLAALVLDTGETFVALPAPTREVPTAAVDGTTGVDRYLAPDVFRARFTDGLCPETVAVLVSRPGAAAHLTQEADHGTR